MASDKQIAANRVNAQSSSGPQTGEGKRRSRRNSLKHGVFSRELLLPWEDVAGFQGLLNSLLQDLKAEGMTEQLLVEQMAVTI